VRRIAVVTTALVFEDLVDFTAGQGRRSHRSWGVMAPLFEAEGDGGQS